MKTILTTVLVTIFVSLNATAQVLKVTDSVHERIAEIKQLYPSVTPTHMINVALIYRHFERLMDANDHSEVINQAAVEIQSMYPELSKEQITHVLKIMFG